MAEGEDDLDALLSELGGNDEASEPSEPSSTEPTPAGDDDLDALLAELGVGEPAAPPEEAPSADDDLDKLLAELGGDGEQAAAPEPTALEEPAPEETEAPTSSAAPARPPEPKTPPRPVRGAFDYEEPEPEPKGPAWSKFSRPGYSGKEKGTSGRARPWKRAGEDAGGDEPREGSGWDKLGGRDERPDDGPEGPTAGWDKLRR